MHNANSDLTRQHPNYAVRIVAEDDQHLSAFADTETELPVIATTSQLLSTGIDLPTTRNIVLFRPIGSMALFKQIIGRGTRLFPDEDKLSFDIIDYSGATALFEDPEFDGPPERVDREEIDDEGNVVDESIVEEPEPVFDSPEEEGTIDPDAVVPREKFYVDQTEVWITAEAVYQLDPDTDRLRLVEYRDHVADSVRALYPDAERLRSTWATRDGRRGVLEALAARGIDDSELGERTGLASADVLDVLVHLAWNQPLATRAERARRVRKEHAEFFEEYRPAAREVLEELLRKYADHGIAEFDDLNVLRIPPLSSWGSPAEIAERFGGGDDVRTAVAGLQDRLYAA